MLYCGAGRAGRARGRGAQGAQAAWALGRWAARAQARGALKRAGAGQQARRACVGARTGAGARMGAGAREASSGVRGVRSRGGRRAAWAGQDCALGAPDLIFKPVFDSVFFLSQ